MRVNVRTLVLLAVSALLLTNTDVHAQRRRPPRGQAAAAARPAEAVSCDSIISVPNQEVIHRLVRDIAPHSMEVYALSQCAESHGRVWGLKLEGLTTRATRDPSVPWAEGNIELIATEVGVSAQVSLPIRLGGTNTSTVERIRLVDVDGDNKPEVFVERVVRNGQESPRKLRSLLELRDGQIRTVLGDPLVPSHGAAPLHPELGRVVDIEDTNNDGMADRVHVTRGFHADRNRCEGGGYGGELIGSAWRAHRQADGVFVVGDAAPNSFSGAGGCGPLMQSRSYRHFGFDTVGRAIMCMRMRGDQERDIMFRVAAYCRRFENICVAANGDEGGVSDTGSSTDIVCPAYWQDWSRHNAPSRSQ